MRQISETNQGEGAGDIATQGDKSGRRSRRQVSQGDMPGRRSRRQGREISQGDKSVPYRLSVAHQDYY